MKAMRGTIGSVLLTMILNAALLLLGCEPAHGPYGVRPPAGPLPTGFSSMDESIIRDYYRRSTVPPGWERHPGNPPWLQQQIQRGALMPQGLVAELLPPDLERLLLPLPAEFVRLRVGPDIVLLDRQMNIIVDVLKGVAR